MSNQNISKNNSINTQENNYASEKQNIPSDFPHISCPTENTPPFYQAESVDNIKPKKSITLDNLPELLTIKEVAELLRVSPLTIKRWGKRGKLPAIRINSRGDRRYKKEAVLWLLGMQTNKEEI